MQKHVNLVDLVKSFPTIPTNIILQTLASIQKKTSSRKFAHLAEKSENGSISNLSTKVTTSTWAAPKKALRALWSQPSSWLSALAPCAQRDREQASTTASSQRSTEA